MTKKTTTTKTKPDSRRGISGERHLLLTPRRGDRRQEPHIHSNHKWSDHQNKPTRRKQERDPKIASASHICHARQKGVRNRGTCRAGLDGEWGRIQAPSRALRLPGWPDLGKNLPAGIYMGSVAGRGAAGADPLQTGAGPGLCWTLPAAQGGRLLETHQYWEAPADNQSPYMCEALRKLTAPPRGCIFCEDVYYR